MFVKGVFVFSNDRQFKDDADDYQMMEQILPAFTVTTFWLVIGYFFTKIVEGNETIQNASSTTLCCFIE